MSADNNTAEAEMETSGWLPTAIATLCSSTMPHVVRENGTGLPVLNRLVLYREESNYEQIVPSSIVDVP